jgi:hypothetical protein
VRATSVGVAVKFTSGHGKVAASFFANTKSTTSPVSGRFLPNRFFLISFCMSYRNIFTGFNDTIVAHLHSLLDQLESIMT